MRTFCHISPGNSQNMRLPRFHTTAARSQLGRYWSQTEHEIEDTKCLNIHSRLQKCSSLHLWISHPGGFWDTDGLALKFTRTSVTQRLTGHQKWNIFHISWHPNSQTTIFQSPYAVPVPYNTITITQMLWHDICTKFTSWLQHNNHTICTKHQLKS